jgi:signal transduction histidine kinase/ActR/RegA family two-component response regulator
MADHSRDRDLRSRSARYGVSLLAVAIACSAEMLVFASAPLLSLMPLSLAVAVGALAGGFRAGAFGLVLSGLAIDYFFVEPGSFFTLGDASAAFAFSVYIAGWLAFCLLSERRYRRSMGDLTARHEAERVARQADRLAQLTAALGQARTPAAVIEAAIQEPLHALRADAGMVLLVSSDGTRAELARAVGYRSDQSAPWECVSVTERSPVFDAIGRGAPVIMESLSRATDYDSLPPELYPRDWSAMVAVPLLIGSRVVAVVRLDFRRAKAFSPDDREYLFSLGPRAAQALDRTWQYEYAQRARVEAESLRARADQELAERQKVEQALRASENRYRALAARTSRLHGLTAALSEAVTLHAVAQAVVHQGKIVVGATAGEVALVTGDGTVFETLYSGREGYVEGEPRRFVAETGLCETQAIQTRQPVFLGSFPEWQERYWRSASLAADEGFVSSATLPLMVEGHPIGVLAFYFTLPVNFDESYQALLVSVAQHCAQALDRARLYESAQRARADAEAANRLKDDFVSIVSHELRTPLNAILGWTSMLQRGSLEAPVGARALQSIHDNATRQARLIDELLDFSRIIGGRTRLDLEMIDLRDLIRGVVESIIPSAAAHGLDLQLSAVPPVLVHGDLRRLEQVFFNLLTNAVKFTPAGGRIAIEARTVDESVEIRVVDNGVGIEPEFLPHAFDRFRQADSTTTRNHGGLGLGLSIARQLVEAHKGTIDVQSEGPGRGSTFIVRLPVAGQRPERAAGGSAAALMAPRPNAEGPPRLDGVRVLIVDDEPDAREILAHELRGCGALVSQAGSASDALERLEEEEVDVLLADIAMPEEDGYALIRKVRSSSSPRVSSIPAAAVTAHARDDERQQALAAGFHLHMAKPIDPEELARAVETLVRGNSVVH